MPLIAEELGWFEFADERVLGLLVRDITDDDYACYVLGRDAKGRFRAVWLDCSIETEAEARSILERALSEQATLPEETFHQGDEVGRPTDFFRPIVEEVKLSPHFQKVATLKGYSPARELLSKMMFYFQDLDGNFVEQFQTTAFDARLWELYLYATFTELGYRMDHSEPVPDFHCQGLRGEFFVEATTVNPSVPPVAITPDNAEDYIKNYVPMKFAGVLHAKLKKRDWEKPHVAGHPFLLAVQDFHAPRSMVWSADMLVEYLYGTRASQITGADGNATVSIEPIPDYQWGNKTPIPSGFFLQPDTEHISAVIANPSGTLSKFNRIGFISGFGARDILMLREGDCFRDEKDDPEKFALPVHHESYRESWLEGMRVYHNPRAIRPLHPDALPNAAHFLVDEGRIAMFLPEFHPLREVTHIVSPANGVVKQTLND